MLEPRDRQLLFDCLRPPAGYRFDCGVATTFSLDLLALLTLPLAFTVFDCEDEEGRPKADPHELLEALRRHASRLSLFCQAGQIHVPKPGQLLYGYLETSVFEATAPAGGVFHPKVTVLRYVPLDARELPDADAEIADVDAGVRYRVLCASRNLTFDRSWDTILALEGPLADRQRAFSRNRPLHEFVAALPTLSIRPLPSERRTEIERIADELLRVDFEPPAGFDDVAFWPLGHTARSPRPFQGRLDRVLIMSPFLTDSALQQITQGVTNGSVLISRHEALDALDAKTIAAFDKSYYLNPAAEPAAAEMSGAPSDDGIDTPDGPVTPDELQGLHAKLIAADAGWNARIWTGSANATDAAFNTNVEFLVELTGKKSLCGIDALLGGQDNSNHEKIAGRARLIDLLEEYQRSDSGLEPDPVREELEAVCRDLRQQLAAARMEAQATIAADASRSEYELCVLQPASAELPLPTDTSLRCWPITLPDSAAAVPQLTARQPVARFALSFKALTSFFAFEITARRKGKKLTTRFVLNLPLRGAPEDRQNRILLALLENRRQVLRYLLMLLADDGGLMVVRDLGTDGRADSGAEGDGNCTSMPLLEALLSTLERQPGRLDQVAQLVKDLRSTAEGRALLPERFDEIWEPIWEMRGRRSHG